MRDNPMRIFTSDLTDPPRYYATRSYRSQIDTVHGVERVVVTGKKWDVTEEIEKILAEAMAKKKKKLDKVKLVKLMSAARIKVPGTRRTPKRPKPARDKVEDEQ